MEHGSYCEREYRDGCAESEQISKYIACLMIIAIKEKYSMVKGIRHIPGMGFGQAGSVLYIIYRPDKASL